MSLASEFEDYPQATPRRRAGQGSKSGTSLRSLLATVAWLDVVPRWSDGRVVWPIPASPAWEPSRADLARTERALSQLAARIRLKPELVGRALTGIDCNQWVVARNAKLEAAKRLLLLDAPDLATLAKSSHTRNPKNAERLAELLVAEALCHNSLPVSPARALLVYGVLAQEPLSKLAADLTAPHPARALAALVLGAQAKRAREVAGANSTALPPTPLAQDDWAGRAYAWGQRRGLPNEAAIGPALLVWLLEAAGGARHATACFDALRYTEGAGELVTATLLGGWLDRGVAPARWPELIAAIAPLVTQLERLRQRPQLQSDKAHIRRKLAEQFRRQRQELCDTLQQQLHAYWRATPDVEIPALIAEHTRAMLNLGDWNLSLADAVTRPLKLGQSLPASLQRPWLELLVKRHRYLWNIQASERVAQDVLERCWSKNIRPLHEILKRSQDPVLALEMQDLGLPPVVDKLEWHDTGLWRWLSELTRDMNLYNDRWDFWRFCEFMARFESLQQARATAGPLIDVLASSPPPLRKQIVLAVFDSTDSASELHLLPAVARYAPASRAMPCT